MPNGIKYNLSAETLALKKGNFWIGTGDVPKGPTSTTGYWNGITPPSGGYTIYLNKASNGPSIYVPSNDSQLISLTNGIAGTSFTSATQCLNYYATQTDKMVLNRDYEGIITNGLVLNLDAGFTPSYSTSGVTWYDLAYSGYNGTLTNGPTYSSSNGGSIVFDATDDRCIVASDGFGIFNNQRYTIDAWVKFTTNSGDIPIFSYDYTSFNYPYYAAHLRHTGTGKVYLAWNMGGFSYTLETSTSTIFAGNWYHIVGIVESGRQQIYVNNVLKNSNTITGTITFYNVPAYVGYYPHSPLIMNGNMAIVRVYNRALSSSEVTTNWNAQKSRFGL